LIPLVDLRAQYLTIKEEVAAAIDRVLESSQFTLGDEVEAFEKEFGALCDARYVVAVNTGTSALHLALLAAGVGTGDEVITAPNTFIATCEAISYTGARPVFVDVDSESYTLDTSRLEAAITPRTKAIVPIHLYGQPADLDPILDLAKHRGLAVVEDACQAHGAWYKGRRVGAIGLAGCFSFYPAKNLGAYGEGGALATNDERVFRMARSLRDHGQSKRYYHDVLGYNYRMDGLQGAILRVKLRHLEQWTETRRSHAERYNSLLRGGTVATPVESPNARGVYHLYVIRVRNRDSLQRRLAQADVGTGIHYPIPCHLQRAYTHLGYRVGDFPSAEGCAEEVLSLPMFSELTEDQITKIASLVVNHDETPS
jgi:dTDP-4-amino-4,6-dideoxygalactose transaminase